MYPILFTVGRFPVYAYGVFAGLAFLIGIWYATRRGPKYQVKPDAVLEVSILCIFGAIIGSRIAFVWLNWQYFQHNLSQIFLVREGGLTFYGGVIGAVVFALPYILIKKYPIAAIFDICTPPIALGYAIARFGCFLNGCCYGRACTTCPSWFTVNFPGLSFPRFPTQLISIGYSLAILGILLVIEKHKQFSGELFLDFLWLYGIARFGIEYFREEPYAVWGIFTIGQFACLLIIAGAFILREMIRRKKAGGLRQAN